MLTESTKKIVLLSGPAGSGTSAILQHLAASGLATLDADELAHRAMRRGGAAHQQIVARFGNGILDSVGEIDRLRLNRAVRADPRESRALRFILYPLIHQQLRQALAKMPGPLVFVRIHHPEAYGARRLADEVWLCVTSPARRLDNLVAQRGWPLSLAAPVVRYSGRRPARAGDADRILQGDGPTAELWTQIGAALRSLGYPGNVSAPQRGALPPEASLPGPSRPVSEDRPERVTLPDRRPAPASAASGAPRPLMRLGARGNDEAPAPGAAPSLGIRELRLLGRRLLSSLAILLAIAHLTSWGLILAEYGRQHLPVDTWQAAWRALGNTVDYVLAHPATYYWAKQDVPWTRLVGETLTNSAGLLLISMVAAVALGFPMGIAAAQIRRGPASSLIVLLSVAGASTPSFLLGMMLWAANIWIHRTFEVTVLPATGFGWDGHLVMPVLVLAMRPLAQVAQITYISVREALDQDYVRTAHSKGLAWLPVQIVHVLPNVLIPILNTVGASLRFSLASLPIVEVFFHWPGVGLRLLEAIGLGIAPLVIDLILSLGLFFLLINLLIEVSFPLIDPRLRADGTADTREDSDSMADDVRQVWEIISAGFQQIRERLSGRRRPTLPALPWPRQLAGQEPDALPPARRSSIVRSTIRNPALVVGSFLLAILTGIALLGEDLPRVDPYQIHGVMSISGEYSAPPFKPSPEFPWGSDHIGRDIRSLVLSGARRTLSLVFFGMLGRILLGTTLGLLAGWRRGSWFDRVVSGAMGIWAAFPATLFAMIVIQALGIQQGMWVFVVAVSIVGWGEVAQIVRARVVSLKPLAFMESARAIGARADQMLMRHILPNLANPLTVLAALEMGGILMLLAELGFLNVFMGGGFRAVIGEAGGMVPIVATYSDVPEWAALIANVREYWRSYPWMALFPGLAIFLSIVSFNLFGEGLRRFLDENAIGLGKLFGRRTLLAAGAVVLVLALVLRSSAPLNLYRSDGLRFEDARALQDVQLLADPQLGGRETGTAGADLAALYIGRRMEEIGLMPGGEGNGYYQRLVQPRLHLSAVPVMRILDSAGAVARQFEYRRDFVEVARFRQAHGGAQGKLMGAAYGPQRPGETNAQFGLGNSAAMDHILIVRQEDFAKVVLSQIKAVLIVTDDPSDLRRRDVYPYQLSRPEDPRPVVLISPQTADALLSTAGSSLAELDARRSTLAPGTIQLTPDGSELEVRVEADLAQDMLEEAYVNVIGVIPGQGYMMGVQEQVIMVGAYYDGLGTDPGGELYRGANDNASGVATMLEIARLLQTSSYRPDKTVLFVAWAGGERQEGLSISNIMNARAGASELTVETVIELSGVGYGSGAAISIGDDSSYRLVRLFQAAASRYDAPTTTLGRGPHYDFPVASMFGGRKAMTLSVSWDGADDLVHTPADIPTLVDPAKLRSVGQSVYLTLLVLSRETEY